ncbi:ribonuclease P [Candidatus Woesearchaeota archaeon]|nr:ribonuclease P [Candidatus Woesearchaeota archaeon]
MAKPLPKKQQQKIAQERIYTLFQQAEKMFSKDRALAHRYVSLARKVAMKVKARIPAEFKRRYCKYCYRFLMPGINSRIRTRGGKVIISCLECKKFMRIPLR